MNSDDADLLQKMRTILEKMIADELLPPRAAKAVAALSAATTPEDLGMDSLARFALLGELKKTFGKKIDPRAVSSATCVGEVMESLRG